MDIVMEGKPRVNASMLPSRRGSQVILLGKVNKPPTDGSGFVITAPDDQEVRVNLSEPMEDAVSGLVEVHGIVEHNYSISCNQWMQFGEKNTQNFDMRQYNKAIMLASNNPEYYVTKHK